MERFTDKELGLIRVCLSGLIISMSKDGAIEEMDKATLLKAKNTLEDCGKLLEKINHL